MHSIITVVDVKIYVMWKSKRPTLKYTPTCFGSHRIHRQGVIICTWLKLRCAYCVCGWCLAACFGPVVCVCAVLSWELVLCKMPHIFTNAEYANMLYVYGFCDGSTTAGVEEYLRRFSMRRIPDRRVFFKVSNTLLACNSVLLFHLNDHVNNMWRNRKAFLKW